MRKEVYEVLQKVDNGDYGRVNVYANIYDYQEDEQILVIEDWDSARFLEKIFCELLKDDKDFEKRREDEYDTSAIDYITEENWTFIDEGFVCDDCYKWYYYNDNGCVSYQNYKITDGYIQCEDCLKKNPELYIEDMINNHNSANTILDRDDLLALGFEEVNVSSYRNGWYGRADDPKEILEKAMKEYPNSEFLFSIVKTYNPWETEFDLYRREVE